ncbi:hypothetical protein HNP48_002285 [Acidovorax soli]|uniref:Uncharacterized protein n=1 Tax=Acidovorax soli TaxID=592050 RepID=A0A7X0U937_9BURK|nr:hypothetical protein [Acidovorax soli]MBB6559618.1 hypothetical protein [Acidovorax soli]
MNAINPTIAASLKGVVPETLLYSEEELLAADVLRMQGAEARQRAAFHRALQDQQQHLQMAGQLR